MAESGSHSKEWAGQDADWVSQSWGAVWSRQAPMPAWRTPETDRQAGESQSSPVRRRQVLACHQTRQREVCPRGCQLAKLSDLSEGPGPTHLMPQLVTGHRQPRSGKRLNLVTQRLGGRPRYAAGGCYWCLLNQCPRSAADPWWQSCCLNSLD